MRNNIIIGGRIWSIVFFTFLAVVLSVTITSITHITISSSVSSISLFTAVIAPIIIAPILLWYIIDLLIKVHHLEEEQRKFATYDYLTGTMTRRLFLENSSSLLKQCERNNTNLTIAIIDIDNFKSVNDTFGHAGGDEVLRSFSALMRSVLRTNDMIGRIGGEEFAVAMFGENVENAIYALERLRISVEENTVNYLDKKIPYTISIGLAGYDAKHSNKIEIILKDADDALYKAKSLGKNCIQKK